METPAPARTLTPIQVAAILGVSAATVRRWADDGRLPCWRTPTGHRRFTREDVDRLLSEPERAA